jgi:NAD-dependent dihydropyrimidine dehydrogenase PreA subunit
MIELPLLDETRCRRCFDCVAICPKNCLTAYAGRPFLIRPTDCISCGLCVLVCPSAALSLASQLPLIRDLAIV